MVIAVMGIRLPLVVSTVGIWQLALYSTPNPFSCDTITLILFQHVSTVFCLEENVSTTKTSTSEFFCFQFSCFAT